MSRKDVSAHCATCTKLMRPYKTRLVDHPGTVARASASICMSCYQAEAKRAKAAREAAKKRVNLESRCVLVRVDLRPSTWRVFDVEAKRRGVGIGDVLSDLADAAVRVRS